MRSVDYTLKERAPHGVTRSDTILALLYLLVQDAKSFNVFVLYIGSSERAERVRCAGIRHDVITNRLGPTTKAPVLVWCAKGSRRTAEKVDDDGSGNEEVLHDAQEGGGIALEEKTL